MESIIKCRLLIDTLNSNLKTNEKELFLKKLIESFGIEFIFTCIFNHFAASILQLKEYNKEHVSKINDIVSDIIHSRNKNEPNTSQISDIINDQLLPTSIKMDELPTPVIARVASFLAQTDYFSLESVNRCIYVGCNTPFSLQTIKTHDIINDAPVDLLMHPNKLSLIKSLNTSMGYFTDIIDNNLEMNQFKFRNLKTLSLKCEYTDEINEFLDQDCFDFSSIETLKCNYFGEYDSDNDDNSTKIDTKIFMQFLAHFVNVKHLHLGELIILDDSQCTKNDIPLLHQLKRITIEDYGCNSIMIKSLIDKHSKQLERLHCVSEELLTMRFPKLRYFKFTEYDTTKNMIKNTTTLEAVCIQASVKDVGNTIVDLINTQSNLTVMEFHYTLHYFDSLITEIEKALEVLNKEKRKELRIRFYLLRNFDSTDFNIDLHDENWLISSAKRILNKLNGMDINNFMVDVRYANFKGSNAFSDEEFVANLIDLNDEYLVHHSIETGRYYKIQFAVANKDNQIHGGYNAKYCWECFI